MRAQQLALSKFAVSVVLLLVILPAGTPPLAAQSRVTALQDASPMFIEDVCLATAPQMDTGDTYIVFLDWSDVETATPGIDHGSDGTVDETVILRNTCNLQGRGITKTVTPTGQVECGDELTYTLVISAAPGVQVGLYDPLTSTTFTRFVEQPATGVITHTGGIITGTLAVTPTNQVTVSFVVQVDFPDTLEQTDRITNSACVYPFGGTLGGCVWSNEVSNALIRKVYLPLVLRNYVPIKADFTAWPTSGVAPLTVVFTNTSTSAYTESLWRFGDGITSTQTSPTHTYTTLGTYTVTLTVRKGGSTVLPGDTSTLVRPNYITVSADVPPMAPSSLQATPISWSQIHLDWQDNSSDETGFIVYDGSIKVADVGANTISYTVGGLASASYHCFRIYAFNDYGNSDWSDWACATTLSCDEGIANGGFEDDSDWEIPDTEYPATYTTAITRTGNRSARAGIVEPADNRESYSSVRQTVTIPADVVSATLRFWLHPVSGEPPANLSVPARPLAVTIEEVVLASDRQYVLVLNEYDEWIRTLVWQRTNDQQWTSYQFDMGVHAGRTIKLQFGAYNDGVDGVTAMYVDDVSLELCGATTQRNTVYQRRWPRGGIVP